MSLGSGIGRKGKPDVGFVLTSWDGWDYPNATAFGVGTGMIDNAAPASILTRFGYRAPIKADGSAYPNAWYQSGTGNAAAEQAVADDQAFLIAEAGITARGFLWYPPAALVTSGGPYLVSNIYRSVEYYLSSANSSLHKYCFVIQDTWASADASGVLTGTWLNYPGYLADWVTQFADARYYKPAGRPWIGIYNNPAGTQWTLAKITDLRNAVTGAGLPNPFLVGMNWDVTLSNALALDGITRYGPSPLPAGSGEQTYSILSADDKTKWTPAGSLQSRVLPVTLKLDTRPRAYVTWFDDPTYTDLETRLRRDYAMAESSRSLCGLQQMCGYSWNEVDEGGCVAPNAQDVLRGPNTPSRGIPLDAIKNVRFGSFPNVYPESYHAAMKHASIVLTGAGWAMVQDLWGTAGGTTGAWKYAELQSTTVGNKWVWTSPYNVTRIKLYGRTFPAGGTFNCHHDAVADTLVNQNAGGTTMNVLLYDSGVLAAGVHSLTATVVTGCSLNELVCIVSR